MWQNLFISCTALEHFFSIAFKKHVSRSGKMAAFIAHYVLRFSQRREQRWIIMMYEKRTAVFAYHTPQCLWITQPVITWCIPDTFNFTTFHHSQKQERNSFSPKLSFWSSLESTVWRLLWLFLLLCWIVTIHFFLSDSSGCYCLLTSPLVN